MISRDHLVRALAVVLAMAMFVDIAFDARSAWIEGHKGYLIVEVLFGLVIAWMLVFERLSRRTHWLVFGVSAFVAGLALCYFEGPWDGLWMMLVAAAYGIGLRFISWERDR